MSSHFKRIQQRWYPSSKLIEAAFTRHAGTLDTLFERLRTDPKLSILHDQFYPGWREVIKSPPVHKKQAFEVPVTNRDVVRSCFYFCNSVIQLMENVYLDLNLAQEYRHPDNRGWINLFRHWSWSGMFRLTWTMSVATYSARFQTFCEDVLGLTIGQVTAEELTPDDLEANARYHASDNDPTVLGKNGQERCFNFLEWGHVKSIIGYDSQKMGFHRKNETKYFAYQLFLPIPGVTEHSKNSAETSMFSVGYAIVRGVRTRRLVMYRIQDHLRTMGLGRAGLLSLLEAKQIRECAKARELAENMKKAKLSEYGLFDGEVESDELRELVENAKQNAKPFLTLFDDVKREAEQNS